MIAWVLLLGALVFSPQLPPLAKASAIGAFLLLSLRRQK